MDISGQSIPSPSPSISSKPSVRKELIINSDSEWLSLGLRDVFSHFDLLTALTMRDVRARYKQTILGAAWAVLNPLMTMLIFVFFVGPFMRAESTDLPYFLVVYTGLLPWTLFAAVWTGASNSVITSESLIGKVYFPRLIIPLAAGGSPLVDLGCSLAILLVYLTISGFLSWSVFLMPLAIAAALTGGMGLGIFFAALNVKYRDFRYIIPFCIQMGLFATPSIYHPGQTLGDAEHHLTWIELFNPMMAIVNFFRASALGLPLPWTSFLISFATCNLILLVGLLYFRRMEDSFADSI